MLSFFRPASSKMRSNAGAVATCLVVSMLLLIHIGPPLAPEVSGTVRRALLSLDAGPSCPDDCFSGQAWGACNRTTGTCVCALGRGGADCSFGLETVFGSSPVYSTLRDSSDLRPEDLQSWNFDGDRLDRYLSEVDASVVIEVGVWKGRSTAHMARWLKERGRGVMIACDTWLGSHEFFANSVLGAKFESSLERRHGYPTMFWTFLSNMIHQGVDDVVVPLPQASSSSTIILSRHNLTLAADFVHIDAGHEYGAVKEDVHIWWPFVRYGGIMMGDDFLHAWPGVQKAAREFALMCDLDLVVDGPKWVIRKPQLSWFEEHPELPAYCYHGESEHMVGQFRRQSPGANAGAAMPTPSISRSLLSLGAGAQGCPNDCYRSKGWGECADRSCACALGRGGADCGFGLETIFGGAPVYSDLRGSPDFREADLQSWNFDGRRYNRYLSEVDASTVIEVGVWKGRSTAHMARWLKERGRGVMIACDTWLGSHEFFANSVLGAKFESSLERRHGYPTMFWTFLSNMIHQGVDDVVVPLPQASSSSTIILSRHNLTLAADFVHIDAGHEYGAVKDDILSWWPFVRYGGIMMGDDFSDSWPGVQKAAREFALLCEFDLVVDGPKWVIRKPQLSWFEEHLELPAWCLEGKTEHLVGQFRRMPERSL